MARNVDYARFDSSLFEHKKFIKLLGHPDGAQALIGWWRLVCWARKNTDPHQPTEAGVIDEAVAKHVLGDGWEPIIDLLADCRLLDLQLGQWQLHDYAEHQDLAGWDKRQAKARDAVAARERRRQNPETSTQVSEMISKINGEMTPEVISKMISEVIHNPTQPNPLRQQATLDERADVIAKIIWAKTRGVIAYMGVKGLARTALKSCTDGEVVSAMMALVAANRGITAESLRIQLTGGPPRRPKQTSYLYYAWYNQREGDR